MTFKEGYEQALSDVVEILTPVVTSFDQYIQSGDVLDVLKDINGLVDEISILNGRNA